MKKALTLLLAVCMLLMSVSAFAESSVTGTWYLVMMGFTTVTMSLNEDGTCIMDASASAAESENIQGTWTQEADKITIVANGTTLLLTQDGDSLRLDSEGIATLGLDSYAQSSGVNMSVIMELIKVTREPGIITMAEFTTYQENGTLPEGKTEEDMQLLQVKLLAAFTSLTSNPVTTEYPDIIDVAPEIEPELTILENNFYVREGYSGQEGIYLAKVQNNNDVPVYLSEGSLVLFDADNNVVGKEQFLSTTGSRYLEPGEVTFTSIYAEVDEGSVVNNYEVNLRASNITPYSSYIPDVSLKATEAEIREEKGYFTTYYSATTVTNTTDVNQSRISVIMAIRDSNGNLVDLAFTGLYLNELTPGSTIVLIDTVDYRAVDYCATIKTSPEQIEALAWINP